MRRPITISLSPNTEQDDIAIAWRSLFRPWKWWDTSVFPKLEQQIAELFVTDPLRHGDQVPQVALTSSGRSAIYAALKALEIGEGDPSTSSEQDEVIIQAFTCLAVPAAVTWAGAKPVFADVLEVTYNLDPADVAQKVTPHTKAIIVQHTFGLPANLSALKAIADQHNLILIEDLAHSLGGRAEGKALGVHGDVATLSFGRDKTISSVFGGAVVSQNEVLIAKVREQQAALPLPSLFWSKQQLLHPIFMAAIFPLYFVGGIGKTLLVLLQKLHVLSMAVSAKEKLGATTRLVRQRFSPALSALLQNQLTKLPKYTEHRRRVAYHYQEAGLVAAELKPYLDDAAWLRVPLRVADAAATLRQLRQKKMLLGDWYSTPVTPCSLAQETISSYTPASCPVAETLAKTTINLPTYPLMGEEDVSDVIREVKRIV